MVLKCTLGKAVEITASALEDEVVGSRHSQDEAHGAEAAEETFTFALFELDGKPPVGVTKQRNMYVLFQFPLMFPNPHYKRFWICLFWSLHLGFHFLKML